MADMKKKYLRQMTKEITKSVKRDLDEWVEQRLEDGSIEAAMEGAKLGTGVPLCKSIVYAALVDEVRHFCRVGDKAHRKVERRLGA